MQFAVDQIRVASPCNARWQDMTGDERARFCGQCRKHVYNLSVMTRAQIETLVREKEGKFCGRFYQRADGRLLTADCPSRLRRVRSRLAQLGGALCALLFSLAGCSPKQTNSPPGHGADPVLMGEVAVPSAVCRTNPPSGILGKIALPAPAPATNSRVLLGQVSVAPRK